jgi:hypothetical protein
VTYSLALMIESLVACLLLITIGYCVVLNGRLKRLRADEQSLKATIAELVTATEIAERAVIGLKNTANECEDTLGDRLRSAERVSNDLERQLSDGEVLLARMSRVLAAGRSLKEEPQRVDQPERLAPDPKAVAAAARSFADRLRERVGTLAAA